MDRQVKEIKNRNLVDSFFTIYFPCLDIHFLGPFSFSWEMMDEGCNRTGNAVQLIKGVQRSLWMFVCVNIDRQKRVASETDQIFTLPFPV